MMLGRAKCVVDMILVEGTLAIDELRIGEGWLFAPHENAADQVRRETRIVDLTASPVVQYPTSTSRATESLPCDGSDIVILTGRSFELKHKWSAFIVFQPT